MSKITLPQGQDNIIMRNQEAYGFLPKDVIDRLGNTALQLLTEDQTALGAINEIKSNLTELEEYSETEQVVGKWVDGSTLYRKAIILQDSTAGNIDIPISTTKLPTSYNVRTAKIVISYKLNGAGQEYRLIGSNITYFFDGSHKIKLGIGGATIAYTIVAIFEYTK